jgi:hypothetical protein
MKKLNLSLIFLVFLMVSCTDNTTIISDQSEVNEQNLVSEEDLILNAEDSLLHIPSNTTPYKIGYIDDQEIQYIEVDGQAIVDGDMLIDRSKIRDLRTQLSNKSALYSDIYLWSNNTVYYTFHSNLSTKHRNALVTAMNEWSKRTKVKFVKRTSQKNYVIMKYANEGNSATVGMAGGAQTLNLKDAEVGTAIHELGHTLGMVHEHQRKDRDNAIIVYDNTQWFKKLYNNYTYTAFDFNSIMLYPSWYVNGKWNMVRKSDKKPFDCVIEYYKKKNNGSYAVPSSSDVYAINYNYR